MGLDPTADWGDEGQDFPVDAPEADTLDLVPKNVGLVCNLSNESIDDAPISELDLVGGSLSRSVANVIEQRAWSGGAASSRLPASLLPQIPREVPLKPRRWTADAPSASLALLGRGWIRPWVTSF
jgi:HK97 family phage major capsid protein